MKLPESPQFSMATILQSLYDLIPAICRKVNAFETQGLTTKGVIVIDTNATSLVLKDTQATPHYWRVQVSNVGALTTTDLGTTLPYV